MGELPTMITSLTMIAGRAGADLAERRIDADGAVGAGLRLLVPRLARLARCRAGAASLMMSGPESSTASGTSGKPRPSIRSTMPFLPNFGSGMPVFASSDAM